MVVDLPLAQRERWYLSSLKVRIGAAIGLYYFCRSVRMKKLTLRVDHLRVDSYETGPKLMVESGTVWANSHTGTTTTATSTASCGGSTCPSPTNAVTCSFTCPQVNQVVNSVPTELMPTDFSVE